MLHPTTPTKADDGIEQLKRDITTKWGINFPGRDPAWSPSRRDSTRIEDRILACVQYLYFRDGALPHAIDQFERHAESIYSNWQPKPRADADVIPYRNEGPAMKGKGDFLRKRTRPSDEMMKDLTTSLWNHLSQTADRVRAGESFASPAPSAISSFKNNRLSSKRNNVNASPSHQLSIYQFFRLKSKPDIANVAQHASSDEFQDEDMTDTVDDAASFGYPPLPISKTRGDSGQTTSTEENFGTPPTTPTRLQSGSMNLGKIPRGSKKRPLPEPNRLPLPQKVSRESRSHDSLDDMISAMSPIIGGNSARPSAARSSFSGTLSTSHSVGNLSSTSTSMTSKSSVTSANTSFSSDSMVSSFTDSTNDTDITVCQSKQSGRTASTWEQIPWSKPAIWEGNQESRVLDPMDCKQDLIVAGGSKHATDMAPPSQPIKQPVRTLAPGKEDTVNRLYHHSPFISTPPQFENIAFRQLYEVTRVSLLCSIPIPHFSSCLKENIDSYNLLWSNMMSILNGHSKCAALERSSPDAWAKAGDGFEKVSLTGKLKPLSLQTGSLFELNLLPLKTESSYRFARKFGHDRFCVIGIPDLKSYDTATREAVIDWLVDTRHCFLGRTWRCFFVQPERTKKTQRNLRSNADVKYRVHLFAEDGVGFTEMGRKRGINLKVPHHARKSVKDLIEWFMSMNSNLNEPSLKIFSRIKQGLTNTVPTFIFSPREIIRSDNAHADNPCVRRLDVRRSEDKKLKRNPDESASPVMNDGCARISRDAAEAVSSLLGLDYVPSAFQGRIGPAKGVWFVDALEEAPASLARADTKVYWIEVTDKQQKFEPHPIDSLSHDNERVTFEVYKYSRRLSSAFLNFQLMPILEDRGVPRKEFIDLFRENLSSQVAQLEAAMEDVLALRKWNQDSYPVTQERASGGIAMLGALPETQSEKTNWLIESGFDPKFCAFFKQLLYNAVLAYCMNLENRMHIGLGMSTNALIIADPLGILNEDEVHVGFSCMFKDSKSGFNENMLHEIDVLVARSPAHLPSDIQKVRAIFKPELKVYKDIVVFPCTGSTPLADKLSGGDYDGDQVWLCWDPRIVAPFHNATVPDPPATKFFGIEEDTTEVSEFPCETRISEFLKHAFNFNMRMNMLGICSNYHEALCYHQDSINSRQAINLAALLGKLVDSNKQGYKFDEAQWISYQKANGLKMVPVPAYKDKQNRPKAESLIDHLVFVVAKEEREKALSGFDKRFEDVPSWDDDLVRLYKRETEEAKAKEVKSNTQLSTVLANLRKDIDKIYDYWKRYARPSGENGRQSTAHHGNGVSFRAIVEKCRLDFVAIAPKTDEPTLSDDTRIRHWQQDHADSRPSYWDLLKASAAFRMHDKTNYVWYIAGLELGQIKATAKGPGTFHTVVTHVFETYKLDGKSVDTAKRRELMAEQNRLEIMDDDADEEGEDNETQYGDSWSQVDWGEYDL